MEDGIKKNILDSLKVVYYMGIIGKKLKNMLKQDQALKLDLMLKNI